ncbi:MAG: hypothetical protein JWM19_1188 [Actinomycetia bacterium]|nr:hypothetical protein [Actinomycetes bacterium]
MDHDDWRVNISFPGSTQAQRAKGLLAGSKVGVASMIGSQAPSGTTVRVEHAMVYLPFVGLTEHEGAGWR